MKADPSGVLQGSHYLDGDHAAAEGAIAAGCRFAAGYPITPSTAVVERLAQRFPRVGDAIFIQMEDELGASIAVQGAAWSGKKVLSVTSGPGLSLMMEHLGLAAMTEVPSVWIDVQRGGPSTGLPTLPAQADMMQARWGSHGDYEIIAICPASPQEAFDYTFDAFNLAEKYRTPVMVMMDEAIGHMIERVDIPSADELEVVERKWTSKKPGDYLPYEVTDNSMVPDMVKVGDGHRFHTTGLTHDERGYPALTPDVQETLMTRLVGKIRDNADEIVRYEEDGIEDEDGNIICDVVIISYGITSRVARRALHMAREKGLKVGFHRMIIAWPFPETRIRELSSKVKAMVMPEMNLGQMYLELERVVQGRCATKLVPHSGGTVHEPEVIFQAIQEVMG